MSLQVAQLEERLDRLDPEQGHISSLEKSLAKALEERIRCAALSFGLQLEAAQRGIPR